MIETEFIIDSVLLVAGLVTIVLIIVIRARISSLKEQISDLRIRLLVHQREQAIRHQLLLDQIKHPDHKPHALDDLQHLFGHKIKQIRTRYPALTDTDIQVLVLIGLGVENHEILTFVNISKRTYYKRRQLIAMRMNTTAAQLDELAKQLLTD